MEYSPSDRFILQQGATFDGKIIGTNGFIGNSITNGILKKCRNYWIMNNKMMRKIILFMIFCLYAQVIISQNKKIVGNYMTYSISPTKNYNYFTLKVVICSKNDTVVINARYPVWFYDSLAICYNYGIKYSCCFHEGQKYSISLKRITKEKLDKTKNSYYQTNAIFLNKNSSRFVEICNNTIFPNRIDETDLVDIDGCLYRVENVKAYQPCPFAHDHHNYPIEVRGFMNWPISGDVKFPFAEN